MSNQRQFIRQAAAVLMACGLIIGMLPACNIAPSSPSENFESPAFREEPGATARREWVIQQYTHSDLPGRNAKWGASILLGRLALNPSDTAAIERAADYYSNVPAGTNGQQFSYPGIAYVTGKHWNKFNLEQLARLKTKIKDFSDLLVHGSENHAIMKCVAAYIFAERWPDEDGWVRGRYSSEQVTQISRARILNVVNGYYSKNHSEWISQNYFHTNVFPWHALYDCATDPEIKYAAYAALCYQYASFAANTFRGHHISPFSRGRLTPVDQGNFFHWLYAGPEYTDISPAANFRPGNDPTAAVTYAVVSDFVMPPAILSLLRSETAPYELTSSSAGFGHHGTTTGFWGTGEPGATNRYIYRHPDYAIGSGFIEYYPDEFYDQHHSNVSILYRSADDWSFIETHHPYWRSNTLAWAYGVNSPFIETAQHKSAAIAIFNIPETDPWAGRGRVNWQEARDQHYDNLIHEAFVRYPKSIDEVIEENGWVFLREGSVYIAIHPLKAYTIDANYALATEDFNTIRSAFAQTGFVYDVATEAEYASFAAFRAAAIQNPPAVDWDNLSVTYTSLAGNSIMATWKPPDYSGPPQTSWVWAPAGASLALEGNGEYLANWDQQVWNPVEGSPGLELEPVLHPARSEGAAGWRWDAANKQWIGPQGDPWYPGSRVLVRPHITINGTVLPPPREYTPDRRPGQDPADFEYYIPMKSPNANIADGVLNVETPGGSLTVYAPQKK